MAQLTPLEDSETIHGGRYDPSPRCKVVIAKRRANERLGCLIDDKYILQAVGDGTPAQEAGATTCIGMRLTRVNGVPVGDKSEIGSIAGREVILCFEDITVVAIAAAPDFSPIKRYNPAACANCGAANPKGWCPCHLASYCSRGCQQSHWPVHKHRCTSPGGAQSVPKKYPASPPPDAARAARAASPPHIIPNPTRPRMPPVQPVPTSPGQPAVRARDARNDPVFHPAPLQGAATADARPVTRTSSNNTSVFESEPARSRKASVAEGALWYNLEPEPPPSLGHQAQSPIPDRRPPSSLPLLGEM